MSKKNRLLSFFGFTPMGHRPPLSKRFWLYCTVAYLMPVVVQVVLPADPGMYDELVWLVTLAPAFLLSLHYGLGGAVAGLIMGTALFVTVQLVVALNFTPDDWRITVPIYIAYGALAISVGWLSEELHEYYQRALDQARLATIGEVAVTMRHELNNGLAAIVAQSQLLTDLEPSLTEEGRTAAKGIHISATRLAKTVRKLGNLTEAPVIDYSPGIRMLDLHGAKARPE